MSKSEPFSCKKRSGIDNSLIYEKNITSLYPLLQYIKDQDKKVWINEYIKNIVQKRLELILFRNLEFPQ